MAASATNTNRRARAWTPAAALLAALALAACDGGTGAPERNVESPDAGPGGDGGASGADPGGAGGAPGAPTATGKFCNGLTANGTNVVLTVSIGGTSPVEMSALSGTCSPPAPQPCTPFSAGAAVPVVLRYGATPLFEGILDNVAPGAEWLFIADVDSSSQPTLVAGPLKPTYQCSQVSP
jgi:hypothetical protein